MDTIQQLPDESLEDKVLRLRSCVHYIKQQIIKYASLSGEEQQELLNLFSFPARKNLPAEGVSRSCSPYYSKNYSDWIKRDLDVLLAQPEDKRFPLMYKQATWQCSKKTIQTRINQAWLYLIDFEDPDKKYADLKSKIKTKILTEGVLLCWRSDLSSTTSNLSSGEMKANEVENIPPVSKWRRQLEDFLDTAVEGEKLELDVTLTAEEKKWIETEYLKDVKSKIACVITKKKIILMHNETLAKQILEFEQAKESDENS